MAKAKKTAMKRLIIIVAFSIVFLALFIVLKNKPLQSPQPKTVQQTQNLTNGILSKENAVAKVKKLPQVIDYLTRVPNGLVVVSGEEDDAYLIQVYEIKDGHTATFNWYTVNKTTGEITTEF